MPAVSVIGDTVMSPDGTGRDCQSAVETFVDEVNKNQVFVNNKLVVVAGNIVGPHNLSGCNEIDKSALSTHSSTVFIGGLGIGRIGDSYGNNIITKGSPNVFAQ